MGCCWKTNRRPPHFGWHHWTYRMWIVTVRLCRSIREHFCRLNQASQNGQRWPRLQLRPLSFLSLRFHLHMRRCSERQERQYRIPGLSLWLPQRGKLHLGHRRGGREQNPAHLLIICHRRRVRLSVLVRWAPTSCQLQDQVRPVDGKCWLHFLSFANCVN